jgi:salicylate hydroxylase
MAVEDGAILGLLLERLQASGLRTRPEDRHAQLTSLLKLYESMRKERTEVNVAGAVLTRQFYHFADGEGQMARDEELLRISASKWDGASKWNWADAAYQKSMLGFNVLADARERFEDWNESKRVL